MQVTLEGQTVTGQVFAGAPYSAFVEFGTGLAGSASDHGELPTSGVPITGSWIYDYRGVGWKGMPAKAYMRPALDSSHRAVVDAMVSAFQSAGFQVRVI